MPKPRLTTRQFIEESKAVHGDRYDYSKTNYTGALNKVIIICKKDGEFRQIPNSHLRGHGCKKCAKCSDGRRLSCTNEFIKKAKVKHGEKYDYTKVHYTHSEDKVVIICKIHGEFIQRAKVHLNGCGCPKCGKESCSSNTNEFIKRARVKHGDKYDYTKVDYLYARSKVIIICKQHGEFKQSPDAHLSGAGCPKCGWIRSMGIVQSKPEIEFLDFLNVPKENRGYPIGKYFVDGVVNNTIYEFLGDYWHGHNRLEKGLNHIDIQIRRMLTQVRFEEIQKLTGFNIRYVWESDWNEYRKLGGQLKLRTFKGKVEID